MTELQTLRAMGVDVRLRDGNLVMPSGTAREAIEYARSKKPRLIVQLAQEMERRVAWPGNTDLQDVRAMAHGLELLLQGAVFEEGDAADRGVALVRSWRKALADHPCHGRAWLDAHRDELVGLIRVALPGFASGPLDVLLEGEALAKCVERVFGQDCWRGPLAGNGDFHYVGHWQ